VQCVERHHGIELVVERQVQRVPDLEAQIRRGGGDGDHAGRRVDTHYLGVRGPLGDLRGDVPVAAAHVEHGAYAGEVQPVDRAVG
jgi:hypothetical protein